MKTNRTASIHRQKDAETFVFLIMAKTLINIRSMMRIGVKMAIARDAGASNSSIFLTEREAVLAGLREGMVWIELKVSKTSNLQALSE